MEQSVRGILLLIHIKHALNPLGLKKFVWNRNCSWICLDSRHFLSPLSETCSGYQFLILYLIIADESSQSLLFMINLTPETQPHNLYEKIIIILSINVSINL